MKSIFGLSPKGKMQKGFTLVELAIVMVIAGIILVGVLRGTDSINKAKVERMVADLKGLQGILLEFHKRTGRYAGDCDNNGVVNNNTLPIATTLLTSWSTATGSLTILDSAGTRQMPPTPVASGGIYASNATCTTTADTEANINLAWNELRRAGVVDANRLPRELARHSMNDVFAIGSMTDTAADAQAAGIIVVYGIPVWMAEAIDAAMDGQATTYGPAALTSAANVGRVRLWSAGGAPAITPMTAGTAPASAVAYTEAAAAGSYDAGVNDRDRLISISYQYTTEKLLH